MIRASDRGILLGAAVLALLLHALLFLAVPAGMEPALAAAPRAPLTRLMQRSGGEAPPSGSGARTVWSPVLFSLPSEMGFSRDLLQKDVRTKLTFSQEVESEQFLKLNPEAQTNEGGLSVDRVKVTSAGSSVPGVPGFSELGDAGQVSANRVYLSSLLKERLVGGIVLPRELNQPTEAPWEASAAVSVTESGEVRHVFLEQPIEPAALSQQVIRLLYSLRFKSGPAVDGHIEIYSAPGEQGAAKP